MDASSRLLLVNHVGILAVIRLGKIFVLQNLLQASILHGSLLVVVTEPFLVLGNLDCDQSLLALSLED